MDASNKRKYRGKWKSRLLGSLAFLFLAAVIIPAGAVMFVVSGLWSALDRVLLRWSRG